MVIPIFIILFVIACVLWRLKSLKSSRGAIKDGHDKENSGDPRSLPEAAIQPSQQRSKAPSTYSTNVSAFDTESTPSEFSDLPRYPQPILKNRTAESGIPEE